MTTGPLDESIEHAPDPGKALLQAVEGALPDMTALAAHGQEMGPDATRALDAAISTARARLNREALNVVIVGEQKSGKSTFLNALLGVRILGTAVRECTATLTRLRWAEAYDYTATFVDGRTEHFSCTEPPRTAFFAAAIDKLEAVREHLERCRAPLSELPAPSPEEPALQEELQEALVDAYRSLAGASVDLEAAQKQIPAAYRGQGSWLQRLAALGRWRRARGAIERETIRHQEAARSVCQAQSLIVARRIANVRQAASDHASARHLNFVARVRALTDQQLQGRDVATLDLAYPGRYLPRDLVLIDTPGVNTEDALHRERAWAVIREDADCCWLVSDLQQALSRSTRDFIQTLRPYVAHVFLVLTKVDRALANATDVGDEAPLEQVEEARRLGIKRFARELDRSPREVFAVAVAAEVALQNEASSLAAAFAEAVATLVALARQERAIVLGARAASTVRQAISAIEVAAETAQGVYQARIEQLEAQRIPQIDAFKQEQLARVKPRLREALEPVIRATVLAAKVALARQQTAWQVGLLKAIDEDELKQTAARAGLAEPVVLAEILEEGVGRLRLAAAASLNEVEALAFEALRTRYRVAQGLTETSTALVPVPPALEGPVLLALGQGLDEALETFATDRLQLGFGGAAAGAALGSLVLPGVGTLVGALVGSLAAFFVSLDNLKADCVKQLEARVAAAEPKLALTLEDAGTAIEAGILDTLGRGLTDALKHYGEWIDGLLSSERQAIEALQERLGDLETRLEALRHHEALLETCMTDAVEASRGLARTLAEEPSPGATVRLNLQRGRRGLGGLKG